MRVAASLYSSNVSLSFLAAIRVKCWDCGHIENYDLNFCFENDGAICSQCDANLFQVVQRDLDDLGNPDSFFVPDDGDDDFFTMISASERQKLGIDTQGVLFNES